MWNLKQDTMNLCTKQEQVHTHRKQTYGHQRGRGVNLEFGVTIHAELCIDSKVLLCNTGKCIQHLVINYNGQESGKHILIYIYIFVYIKIYLNHSLCYRPETTQHC